MSQKHRPPLNAESIRAHLREAIKELNRIDEKRAALQTMIRGHEAWLKMFAGQEPDEAAGADRAAAGEGKS